MSKFDMANGPAVFIMPHWSKEGTELERNWLNATLESIKAQTDSNWKILIADGNSPSEKAKAYLRQLVEEFGGKLDVIFMEKSDGPGHARNVAIQQAYEAGYPFIVFLDADDITGAKRVESARKIFLSNPAVGVVYTTFEIIDEMGQVVPREKLSQSIVEILESHESGNPPQGKDAWIKIATETGYTNLTSATAVRTEVAYNNQFPPEKVSEDYYTWLVYSASGAEFAYTPDAPTKYRIPQNTAGSASRTREGGKHGFYATKCRVDEAGFDKASSIALNNGAITADRAKTLKVKFLLKEAETMGREQEFELAKACYVKAVQMDAAIAAEQLKGFGFEDRVWTK